MLDETTVMTITVINATTIIKQALLLRSILQGKTSDVGTRMVRAFNTMNA